MSARNTLFFRNTFGFIALASMVFVSSASASDSASDSGSAGGSDSKPNNDIDFNREIRPILSDNCFLCHGPAESTRAADLRLDERAAAIESGALVPGDAEDSEIIARIFSGDDDALMPPPDSHKQLTAEQRELLRRWVDEGAEYQDHWSFETPVKISLGGTGNPVDYFLDQRLREAGMQFSREADPRMLIRRVTLDLTGVPPSPTEVNDFVRQVTRDSVDVAYGRLVDRLLASSAYGERMALAWLDAARYGDTSVMHADGPRDMWPWRDWVINAYNSNMPFDRFTVEQLAGDLLPDATVQQRIASGFNRNHATSDEGGAFAEELRVEYVVDRVQTTSTVWMGLTMECAQCHDHKYDPLSQKEYYQFFAYFNNTADPGMQTRKGNQTPVVEVLDPEKENRVAKLNAKIDSSQASLTELRNEAEPRFLDWMEKATQEAAGTETETRELTGLSHWLSLDSENQIQFRNSLTGAVAKVEGGKIETSDREGRKALKLNGKTRLLCAEDAIELDSDKPFTLASWVKIDGKTSGAVFAKMDVSKKHRGWDLWVQGRNIGTHVINKWPQNALKVISKDQLTVDQWHHVVVSYDGRKKASGVAIYIDGKRSDNRVEQDSLNGTVETKVPFIIGSRSTGSNWKGAVDDIRLYTRALSEAEVPLAKSDVIAGILGTDPEKRSESQIATLRNHFFAGDPSLKESRESLASLKKLLGELTAVKLTSMIMTDNPSGKMRTTYVLDRGQYDAPLKDEVIQPGVPAALPPMPADAPSSRLGLAEWLVDPDHPLTSRVAINRYWSMLFGNGLVRTAGDFGAQGAPPTHPELLDWLSRDFVESGWDVKRMLKLLVTSKAYRQQSRIEPEHLQNDPSNLLLARSPRFRLQGEFIRDQALAISGLLVDQAGGPGVKPYQPANIWNEVSLNGGLRYKQDQGGKLYRKSMYTYWKRSAPMPNMMIFDAPSREKCVVQRARTNTPLQALVTLNDPQFVEAARALAERLIRSYSLSAERFNLAYELATSRPISKRERELLEKVLADQLARFRGSPDSAKAFLAIGDSPRDANIDLVEHAAWTVIAQMILNLDETLTRG